MVPHVDYGEKLKFDPQWKGPLGVARTRTDHNWLVAFKIYFYVCIAISIYATIAFGLMFSKTPKNSLRSAASANLTLEITGADIVGGIFLSIPLILLATALFYLYVYLLKRHAVFISYFHMLAMFFISALCLAVCVIIKDSVELNEEQKMYLFTVAIVALFFCVIPLVFMICFASKFRVAVEVIREASKALLHFPFLFFFPIISFFIEISIIIITFVVCMMLYATQYNSPDSPKQTIHFIFILIIVFGGLWVLKFTSDFISLCMYGSFAAWYWSIDKNTIPQDTVTQIIGIAMKYHLGSVAMGSLLLNLVHIIVNAVCGALAGHDTDNNSAMIANSCGQTIHNLLAYLSRNAYIFVASHGTGFWDSAKDAFNILKRNLLNVIVVTEVTSGIVSIAVLFTIGITLLIAYGICYAGHVSTAVLIVVLVLTTIGSAIMCGNICTVLNAAIDTIFLSVLEDYERNDGSSARPYFMSDNLKELIII